jgi:hypothetical protein
VCYDALAAPLMFGGEVPRSAIAFLADAEQQIASHLISEISTHVEIKEGLNVGVTRQRHVFDLRHGPIDGCSLWDRNLYRGFTGTGLASIYQWSRHVRGVQQRLLAENAE